MQGFLGWFVHNRVATNLLMWTLIFGGLIALPQLPREEFPNIDADAISVTIPYPGASPEEVEATVCSRAEEAVMGTPDIKKERAWNVSSSSEYSNHKTRINVTGNYQYIQDFIYGVIESSLWQMTIDANGTKLYTNIEFAHLVSLNGNWTNQWTKKIRTNISATYVHGTKHNGLPLPQIAPLTSTINIEYLHNGWQFQLDVNSALAQNRIDTEFIELPSQGWAVTNVRLAKTVLLKKERKLSIQTGIENLFDNAYYQHLDWAKIQRPGINFYGAVNYSF